MSEKIKIIGVRQTITLALCKAHALWYTSVVDNARREQVIDQWANRLRQWGLAPIAPLLLQAFQPLGCIASQAVLFSQPLLTLFAQDGSVQELAWLLDDAEALEQIERRLTNVNDRAS